MPRFLLSGFTEAGTTEGVLHVTDLRSGKTWQSTPNGAAHQRDYYRVEVPGMEPDAFEVELSRIEARAAEVIQQTVKMLEPPAGEALDELVRFLAVTASRTPPHINHLAKFEEQLLRMSLQVQLSHPKGFEALKKKALAAGRPLENATPEELLRDLDNVKFRFPSTWTVQRLMMHADVMYPFLRPRKWSLFVIGAGAGHFVCSDMPAVIHDPTPRPAFYSGPSFVAPESEFSMPLTCGVVLVGRFDRESAAYVANAKSVAVLNGRAMMYADQLYSCAPDFSWWMRGERIGNASDLRAAIAARPPQEDNAQAPPG